MSGQKRDCQPFKLSFAPHLFSVEVVPSDLAIVVENARSSAVCGILHRARIPFFFALPIDVESGSLGWRVWNIYELHLGQIVPPLILVVVNDVGASGDRHLDHRAAKISAVIGPVHVNPLIWMRGLTVPNDVLAFSLFYELVP